MRANPGSPPTRDALVARREDLGMTQAELAEAASLAESTVARTERGESTPRSWSRRRYATALKLPLDRFDELLDMGAPRAGAPLGAYGVVAVAQLREYILDLDARYDHTPSAALLADAARCLGEVAAAREQARGRVARDLAALEAECAILVGQLVWDASQRTAHQSARAYLHRGALAARSVGDRPNEALALLREAIVLLYGERDPSAGIALARRTVLTAADTSPVLAGLGLLHAAEGHAMMGQRTPCEKALSEAETSLSEASREDPAAELASPTQVGRLAGSCYLALGDPQRAEPILDATVRAFLYPSKSQAIALGNLALAYTRQAKLDAATSAFHNALDVTEATRGAGGLNLVGRVARELAPWATTPSVRDARERLFAVVGAAP